VCVCTKLDQDDLRIPQKNFNEKCDCFRIIGIYILDGKKLTRDISIFDEGRRDTSSNNCPHIEIDETVISTILLAERSSERDRWLSRVQLERRILSSSSIY